jgi:hypothetical protein
MKKVALIYTLLFLYMDSFSQSTAAEIIVKMNLLLTERQKDNGTDLIIYNENKKSLLFDGVAIPVTDNVILKKEKKNGKNLATFYFQEGEAVVKQSNSAWRRAYYEMTFQTGKQAAEFIELFRKLSTLINK